MAKIEISENKTQGDNLFYLQSCLGEIFNHANCILKNESVGGRYALSVTCPEYYSDIIRAEIRDKVGEIIAVKYKYDYFCANLKIGGLNEEEKEILYVSLIAADLEDDKKYCVEKLKGSDKLAIDGVYNFRLQPLRKKWGEVLNYMPNCFFGDQLKDFITYLLENKTKRVYVDKGKIYDGHYRRLKRCLLMPYEKLNVVREVILSNCGQVEICGKVPEEDEKYLKEYYADKIIFSTGYFN